MEQSELEAMAKEMAKNIKTQEDLGQFTSQLMRLPSVLRWKSTSATHPASGQTHVAITIVMAAVRSA